LELSFIIFGQEIVFRGVFVAL